MECEPACKPLFALYLCAAMIAYNKEMAYKMTVAFDLSYDVIFMAKECTTYVVQESFRVVLRRSSLSYLLLVIDDS